MAGELNVNVNIRHAKVPQISFAASMQIDQTGTGVFVQAVDVGTSAETLAFADITTPHVVIIWNLDGTNFVEFGVDDTGTQQTIGKLMPGGLPAIIPWSPGALLSLQADTAACKVHVQVYEA